MPFKYFVTVVIGICVIIGYFMFNENNRYKTINVAKGVAYIIDKKTGQSWMIRGNEKIKQLTNEEKKVLESINRDTIVGEEIYKLLSNNKIQASINPSFESFHGSIYNGTTDTLIGMQILLKYQDVNNNYNWQREYSINLYKSKPYASTTFRVDIPDFDNKRLKKYEWDILKIYCNKKIN